MFERLKKRFLEGWLSNILRHGLTALGAILIAHGLPSDIVLPWVDATVNIVIQAIPIVIAIIWSFLEKRALQAAMKGK